jgi:type IV pilus assembly protein PilW
MSAAHRPGRLAAAQRGYTLVEMMVAVVIALFLLGGLLTMVQTTRRAFGDQNKLAQFQDSERLAMTMMGDVIQASGYFPDPLVNTALTALPQYSTVFTTDGQSVVGTRNDVPPGDGITVRYQTASNDGIVNCIGQTNTTANQVTYINQFAVVQNADGTSSLDCTLTPVVAGVAGAPTTYQLVTGVQTLKITYGVKTDTSSDDNRVDSFLRADETTAAGLWSNVVCVRIELTFFNPLYTAGQTVQKPTITFSRVVGVMNKAGVQT